MEESGMSETETRRQQKHVVAACYLGWTLDAFDFFIMVFVLRDIAASFASSLTAITWAITLTLAMRPVGALDLGRQPPALWPPPPASGEGGVF
jgi:SHS family lactate transporter-like MFS transporter